MDRRRFPLLLTLSAIPTILFLLVAYLMKIKVDTLIVPIIVNLIGSIVVAIVIMYLLKDNLGWMSLKEYLKPLALWYRVIFMAP